MADVEDDVLSIIAEKAKVERNAISRQTELSTLVLDSLDIVEIIFQIEEKFDISIPYNANDASAAGMMFKTVGDVVDLVGQHVGKVEGRQPA